MTSIKVDLQLDNGAFTAGISQSTASLGQFNQSLARTSQAYSNLIARLQSNNALRANLFNTQQINQFQAAVANISTAAGRAGSSLNGMNNSSRGLLSTMRDLSIVAGGLSLVFAKVAGISQGWIGDIVRLNSQMERLNFQMRSMSGAADPIKDAADTITYLQEKSKEMPFALKTITDGFVKMKATGIDPMAGGLKSLADGVAAAGGNDEQLQRAILAITQMSGKGVIQMEELRQQLGEAMPRAVELMARSMGVSMSTLIKEIGRGTVEAKPALAAFFAEVERTYGGQALLMMQTFTGQVQRVQTSLQQLSTGGAIKVNFFDGALRKQLDDLNRFLASDAATMWRDKLGNALAATVNGLRWFLDTAIEFRGELMRLGAVIAATFAFKAAFAGLSSMMGFIDMTRTRLTSLSAAYQALSVSMNTATIRANSGAPAMALMGSRMAVLGNVVRTGIAAFAAYAPLIGIAALAAFTAAEYFGLLSNKTKDAYESLKQYGTESKKQADEIAGKRRKQLEDDVSAAERMVNADKINNGGLVGEDLAQNLLDARNALASFQAEVGVVLDKASDRESTKKLDDYKVTIEKKLGEIQGVYDKSFVQFSKTWDEKEKKAAAAGESVDMVRADRQKATADMQRSVYDDRLKALDQFIETQDRILTKAQDSATPDQQFIKNIQARISYLSQLSAETRQTAASMAVPSVPRVAQSQNEQKLYEKGLANLQKMRAELDGLKEDADGGYGAVVRLERELAAGKYGPTGSPLVSKLIQETLEVKRQIEAQKEVNKEIEKKQRLYENAGDKLEKMRAEITGMMAGLQGVNQDAAELRALAGSGFFGDQDTEKVRELAAALEAAGEAKAELDKMMKGKEKLENDLEAAKTRMIERRLELEYKARGDELTETEKIKIKIQQGYYDGFGPSSPTAAVFAALAKSWDIQKTAAESVGEAVRNQAFGDQTRQSIMSTTQSLREMTGVLQGIKGLASGINFSNMGMPSMMGANPNAMPFKFDTGSGIFELIKKVESGGDYNKTLDNGRWTNGPQNLTSMTINQIRELQRSMLTPENKAVHGDGGSSALGAYQIVGKTLESLKTKMGLTGDELFDQSMQDRMAQVLLAGRQGQGIEGLRNEWEGLKGVDASTIMGALNSQKGPTVARAVTDTNTAVPAAQPVQSAADEVKKIWDDLTKTITGNIDSQIASEKKLQQDEATAARVDYLKELKAKAQDAKRPIEELGQNYGDLLEKIRKGGFGPTSSKDIAAPEYKEMLAAAKELDAVEKKRDETLKAQTQAKTQLKNLTEKEVELQRRAQDAIARYKNPDARVETDEYRKLEQDLNEYVANQKRAYGETSQAAIDAEQFKQNQLRNLRGTESAELAAKYEKEARDIQTSNMSQTQSRAVEMQRQIAMIDQEVAAFQGTEEQKVALVAAAEKKKAAIRAQYTQQDPIGAKLKEWNDLQGNLQTSAAGWMDSLSGGLADVIMGTGDLKQVINGIIHDMLNMGIKYLMSSMLQGAKGGTTGKAGGAAKTGASKLATGGKVGVHHTGGIVGGSGLASRFVSGSIFKNAPKFHTGGMVGGFPKLRGDEVPIIAQKGEGVFTADQMKALGRSAGAGQNIQINAPVTVNASGGTPEQNADLAKQVRKEMEGSMRGLVQSEIFKQQRPGNILNR